MLRRLLPVLTLSAALAVPAAAGAAPAPQTLRLDGIGPLTLGMSRADALGTGWLSDRQTGCKLGGRPYPIDYQARGPRAPKGLRGGAEFTGGKLTLLSFTRGVRTEAGITVAKTRLGKVVSRYDALGFDATSAFEETFGGTFARVLKDGQPVLGAFGERQTVQTLAIPAVPVCE